MKKWLLYIMSFAFSIGFFSCTAEIDIPETAYVGEEVKVSFVLNTSSSRAASDDNLEEGFEWERYIAPTDIRVFVFTEDDKYREEITRFTLNGQDGDAIRTFTGIMKKPYTGKKIQLVVLTNMGSRGVANKLELTAGNTSKKELYKQLVFTYNKAWTFSKEEKNYIPMWGISKPFSIKENVTNDAGQIDMYRAIAKIDIKVNGGTGIAGNANFVIHELQLCNTPDRGYCASMEVVASSEKQFEKASLPNEMKENKEPFTVYERPETETGPTTIIENKIYVPEMDRFHPYPYFYIKIKASIYGKDKEYLIYMRTNQADTRSGFEIIRNHKYMVNIETVSSSDQIIMGYAVNSWGEESPVDLPPFN